MTQLCKTLCMGFSPGTLGAMIVAATLDKLKVQRLRRL